MQDIKKQAHLGWQIQNMLIGMTGGKPSEFLEYIEQLSLLDDDEKKYMQIIKMRKKQKAAEEAQKAISLAEKIKAADLRAQAERKAKESR